MDDRIRKMVDRDGFIDLWRSELNQDETFTDTFHRLNQEYEDCFGKPRYSDYNSFRNSRDRQK